MVERVTAWRTSDGQCFEDKARAYEVEAVWLCQALPQVSRRAVGIAQLLAIVPQYRAQVESLQRLRDSLDAEADAKIVGVLKRLSDGISGWLKHAEGLVKQMGGEVDAEVAEKVAGAE